MLGLARFTMRGRWAAVLVVSVFALLTLFFQLLGLIASGAVGLVTLRRGALDGLAVALLAGLISVTVVWPLFGPLGMGVVALTCAFWLPVWLLALVLRATVSLNLSVQLAMLFGLVLLFGLNLALEDPVAYWAEQLEPLRHSLMESGLLPTLSDEQSMQVMREVARWMNVAFAATFYFNVMLALFIARWWQALLYNPGGFGREFHELRIHPALGLFGVILLGFQLVFGTGHWAGELLFLLLPLYFIQGVAVVHGLIASRDINRGWLFAFYGALVFGAPNAELLVAGLGLADIWADIRMRVVKKD